MAQPGVVSNRNIGWDADIVAGDREAMMPDARSYEAKELVCRECDEWFVFTAAEQRFYAEQGFPPPKRCPTCRAERRRQEQVRERSDTN